MFARLKALKVEIEHLQLLMDKAKVKLQKEFEAWWAKEATSLQVLAAVPPHCPRVHPPLAAWGLAGSQGGAEHAALPWGVACRGKRMRGLDPHQTHSQPLPPEVSAQ